MKIHAYRKTDINSPETLDSLILHINSLPIDKRLKMIDDKAIRLEGAQKQGSLWLLDFVLIRFDHGPGRAHEAKPIKGFRLDKREGFGEETAALYDEQIEHMLVQYNHFGVRAATIAEYLSLWNSDNSNGYRLSPRWDPDFEARLARKTIYRKLRFKLDLGRMTTEMRKAGVSVAQAIRLGEQADGGSVTIEISAKRSNPKGLSTDKIGEMLGNLFGFRDQDDDAVESLRLSARDDLESPTELLDLLSPRLVHEFKDIKAGPDRRYPQEERWEGLARAHRKWAKILTK